MRYMQGVSMPEFYARFVDTEPVEEVMRIGRSCDCGCGSRIRAGKIATVVKVLLPEIETILFFYASQFCRMKDIEVLHRSVSTPV
jgi:hypothetical protein